jgi:hypothetical protein
MQSVRRAKQQLRDNAKLLTPEEAIIASKDLCRIRKDIFGSLHLEAGDVKSRKNVDLPEAL